MDIEEKYRLSNRSDITQVLRSLAKKPETVKAYYDGGGGYLRTVVVAVEPEANRLLLDCGPDESANRQALRARYLMCEAKLDQVDVRFECGPVSIEDHEDGRVFVTPLPEWVLRLQRREYFRVPTLVSQPATCTIATPVSPRGRAFAIADMSLGGIGVLDPDFELNAEPGTIFHACKVSLPEVGEFIVDLEVRNASQREQEDEVSSDRGGQRVGLAYRGLPRDKESLLQRYINDLQLRSRNLVRRR